MRKDISEQHEIKMVAPIFIAVFGSLYYVGFFIVCFILPMPLWIKLCLGIIPLVIIGLFAFVLIERIKEIRSGEEDDLSKY